MQYLMVLGSSEDWKLVLAIALAATILLSAYAKAPRRSVPGTDLRRLVVCALSLYAIGALASLSHHAVLAGIVYAAGITICSLAAWLSRGTDSEDPPDGDQPVDEQPPPQPDGSDGFDWEEFERAFHAYADRQRSPSGVR